MSWCGAAEGANPQLAGAVSPLINERLAALPSFANLLSSDNFREPCPRGLGEIGWQLGEREEARFRYFSVGLLGTKEPELTYNI